MKRRARLVRLVPLVPGALLVAALALPVAAAAAPAAGAGAKAKPAAKAILPWIEDEYTRAVADAKARKLPLFVESWAPW